LRVQHRRVALSRYDAAERDMGWMFSGFGTG
jgi:hypothetical protein